MILSSILSGLKNYTVIGNVDINITNLSHSSKDVKKDGLFFCVAGTKTNGTLYVDEAVQNGATAIVTENACLTNITQIIVENARRAMAVMAAIFFDNPQNKLKIIGITGTNGKTSCSYIIAQLLSAFGKKVGVIGTNGIFIDDKKQNCQMTTPDSIELFSIFDEMVKNSVQYCVMEVSAHAIFFDKIFGINFAVKALTNVTFDHLDFFETIKKYEQTKEKFFETGNCFVLNNDDKIGKKLTKKHKKSLNFGKNNAILQYFDVQTSLSGTSFFAKYNNKICKVKSKLIGDFNVSNLCLSIGVLLFLGFDFERVVDKISAIKNLPGRFDLVDNNFDIPIIVDYAHTYESLHQFLSQVKKISSNKNIIVFGCPGERDTTKRFSMGKLAGEFCDYIILTSDNPASENPKRIMFEMECGVKQTNAKCCCIENRNVAIKKAISMAKRKNGFNVLIVGKGIETYQIVGGKNIPYSDYDAIGLALNKLANRV